MTIILVILILSIWNGRFWEHVNPQMVDRYQLKDEHLASYGVVSSERFSLVESVSIERFFRLNFWSYYCPWHPPPNPYINCHLYILFALVSCLGVSCGELNTLWPPSHQHISIPSKPAYQPDPAGHQFHRHFIPSFQRV